MRKLENNCPSKSMEVLLFTELVSVMSTENDSDVEFGLKCIRDLKVTLSDTGMVINLDKL